MFLNSVMNGWLTTFGRLRPLHTSLVIFGFAGSAQFAASYYAVAWALQTLYGEFLTN